MKIEIPDDLYEEYRTLVKERIFSEDVSMAVKDLIEAELRQRCAPGYQMDILTNSQSRHQLEANINRATWAENAQDHSIFRNAYLCIDLQNFKRVVDVIGMSTSDDLLRNLAWQLQEAYGNGNVYRFGGDEFIVDLGERQYNPLQLPPEITIKYSTVKVVAQRNRHRHRYLNKVILFHLEKGIVLSRPEGHEVICEISDTELLPA